MRVKDVVHQIEEQQQMVAYMNTIERFAMEQGMQQGVQKGSLEQAIQMIKDFIYRLKRSLRSTSCR